MLKKLWDWISSLWKKPDPKPDPYLKDDIDPSLVHWRGPNGANAKLTVSMKDVYRKGENLYYTAGSREWPTQEGGECDSFSCLFVLRAGTAKRDGGKFDWAYKPGHSGDNMKPLNHMVEGGYLDNRYPDEPKILPPVKGETWVFCLLKLDGSERSAFRAFTW